ncbi:MAG: hypothetical protein JJE04_20995 [Acidobacteriia bacterium]|nr:hypothetical protein [Terriglobia bacterium]
MNLLVYLDNDVASGLTQRDLPDVEGEALDQLVEWDQKGRVTFGTSRQSLREMERAPAPHRDNLKRGLANVPLAQDDHRVLDSFTVVDPYRGCIANPLVTDVVDGPLYAKLLVAGLKPDDAKHFMYAAHNHYAWFLTCDRDFLRRIPELEKLCPSIRVGKPSQLVAWLRAVGS